MTGRFALSAARIFDGDAWHEDAALVVANGIVEAIVPRSSLPADVDVEGKSAILAPGFIDLQVNGGGGVMLNDHPDVASIRTICAAHAPPASAPSK